MSAWVDKLQFRLVKEATKHYVLRRNNAGNLEINVPKNITNKQQARRWLIAHPNKIKKPNRYFKKSSPFKSALTPTFRTRFSTSPGGTKRLKGALNNYFNDFTMVKVPDYNCSIRKSLYDGRPGYRPINNSRLKPSKNLVPIGKGRQGIVFAVSTFKSGDLPFAIKIMPHDLQAEKRREIQPAQAEFNIQKAAAGAAPDGVVGARGLAFCKDFIEPSVIDMTNVQNSQAYDKTKQAIIFMNLASGGNLQIWLDKMAKRTPRVLDDFLMQYIIGKVCYSLHLVQKKYPEFRHNDLHIQNIFVDRVFGILIGDFGWARIKKDGTNPAVNTIAAGSDHSKKWGVGPLTDIRYDHHLFLNDIRTWVLTHKSSSSDGFKKTIKFLDVAVPPGYRGSVDTHVNNNRLKYLDPCPNLPTLEQVLNSKFLTRGSAPKFSYKMHFNDESMPAGRKASPFSPLRSTFLKSTSPPKSKPANRTPSHSVFISTSPPIAKPKNRTPPNSYTNSQLLKLDASRYLTLSNANKSRLKFLRKAVNKSKKAGLLVFKNKKNVAGGPAAPRGVHLNSKILKDKRFERLREKIWRNAGAKSNANFTNAWEFARKEAERRIINRIARGEVPFSPSLSSPHKSPARKSPARKSPARKSPARKSPTSALRATTSPKSGRLKILAPTGRLVYANGTTITLNYLKQIAGLYGKNIKDLRTKKDILSKILKRPNKK